MYKEGDRLEFIWRRPFRGKTPGTVLKVNTSGKKLVTVKWDDGTTTKTSTDFLDNRTSILSRKEAEDLCH